MPAKSDKEARESGLNVRLVKALGHPLRVQALQILNLRTASPNELANEMDVSVSLLSYHVRVLRELECIELVRTEPVRGAVEHFYRATSRAFFSQKDWAQVPPSVRSSISGVMWGDIVPVVNEALTTGSFDRRDDRHFSWTPMVLDPEGWEEARAIFAEALPKLLEAQTRSAERLAAAGADAESISTGALMACFETAKDAAKEDAGA